MPVVPDGKWGETLRPIHDYVGNILPAGDLKQSAVLVPFLRDGEKVKVLFTQRSSEMKHHAGQISFPGGRLEKGEEGWSCALRETEEEVGIKAQMISRLGRLDDVYSPRGFHVQCHVGWVEGQNFKVNQREVEQTFLVPLDEIMDPKLHIVKPWQNNPEIPVHYFHFRDCLVWGVTGRITYCLRQVLGCLQG